MEYIKCIALVVVISRALLIINISESLENSMKKTSGRNCLRWIFFMCVFIAQIHKSVPLATASPLFQNLCGTEPHPVRFRAKKYKINENFFSLEDFKHMMTHLPEPVSDQVKKFCTT